MTSTSAKEVCRRWFWSNGEMRTSLCTPCSERRRPYARGPRTMNVTLLRPASSPGEVSMTSVSKPLRSAHLRYMRMSISTQSCASTPPCPTDSVTTALWLANGSVNSRSSSRERRSSEIAALSSSSWRSRSGSSRASSSSSIRSRARFSSPSQEQTIRRSSAASRPICAVRVGGPALHPLPHERRRRRRRHFALDLHPEDPRDDGSLDPLAKLVEHLEGFVLVFHERVALAVRAKADSLAEVLHLGQVLHPLPVDGLQHHVAFHERHQVGANLFDLLVVRVRRGREEMLDEAVGPAAQRLVGNL